MSDASDGAPVSKRHMPGKRNASLWGGLALLAASLILCAAVGEVVARGYWFLKADIPLGDPGRILYLKYPELKEADGDRDEADAPFKVLILGGSVLNRAWSSVELELLEQLAAAGQRDVRIYNLAVPSHTSQDSINKYRALESVHFDLVILYHAINEIRANAIPPEWYREDYSHYKWYEQSNMLASYHGNSHFALPYTLHLAAIRIRQSLLDHQYLQFFYPFPPEEWLQYGANPRSPETFEKNVREIVRLADERNQRIVLMTFANYVPEDYTEPTFDSGELDYRRHIAPLRIWGTPKDVVATLGLHNDIVRKIAAERGNRDFVDQESQMPDGARYYNDVCHFTPDGSKEFARNILGVMPPERWVAPRDASSP